MPTLVNLISGAMVIQDDKGKTTIIVHNNVLCLDHGEGEVVALHHTVRSLTSSL